MMKMHSVKNMQAEDKAESRVSSVPIAVTRNSSGYPVIHAEGLEYAMCE
jgi:hypothetical protein